MSEEWVIESRIITYPLAKLLESEEAAALARIVYTRHLKECVLERKMIEAQQAYYEYKYPNYCRACGATGIVEWEENGAPHGAGYWPMQMTDVCEACRGHCPRCGHEFPEEEWEEWIETRSITSICRNRPCPACGWRDGEGAEDHAPQPHECLCWMHDSPQW